MSGSTLWPLLVGAAITLAGTVSARWFSLVFETRRQREARRADFQRDTLVQIRDVLLELDKGIEGVFAARGKIASRDGGDWAHLHEHHPSVEAVWSAVSRLQLLLTAVEDMQLRGLIGVVSARAYVAATSPSEATAENEREKMLGERRSMVRLLGEQLRRLA